MYKFLSIFVVLILISSFSGCSGSQNTSEKEYPKPVIVMPDEDTAYTVNGYKDTTVPSTSDSSAASSEETTSDSGGTDVYSGRYLGNKNTKKFHTTQCRYIKKTSEENITIFETYEDAISDGYIACSVCNQ